MSYIDQITVGSTTYDIKDANAIVAPSSASSSAVLTYDGENWIAGVFPVTSVNGATGSVTVRELPSVSSSDNDKVLKVVSGTWTAAVDSNEDIMVANITYNSNGTHTSDKTYAQLKAVIDAGGTVGAQYLKHYYELESYSNTEIRFYRISINTNSIYNYYLNIDQNNIVTSGSSQPSYPVTSVNGTTGAVVIPTLPSGGDANQFLIKTSSTDYDVAWSSITPLNDQEIYVAVESGWGITITV